MKNKGEREGEKEPQRHHHCPIRSMPCASTAFSLTVKLGEEQEYDRKIMRWTQPYDRFIWFLNKNKRNDWNIKNRSS
ncbi:hypothetical protein Hdeb2414_s0017g00501071 [Helianthus debilis subsp. tardiflorus]